MARTTRGKSRVFSSTQEPSGRLEGGVLVEDPAQAPDEQQGAEEVEREEQREEQEVEEEREEQQGQQGAEEEREEQRRQRGAEGEREELRVQQETRPTKRVRQRRQAPQRATRRRAAQVTGWATAQAARQVRLGPSAKSKLFLP